MFTKDTKICGIPVTVEYDIEPADKSVGIMSEGISEWTIVAINGKPVKKSSNAAWLEKKMTREDEENLCDELMASFNDYRDEMRLDSELSRRGL